MASWQHSLFDGGVHDCLQAYFTPCCLFGQTRYRLERIDSHENPLDLDGYNVSNGPCWDWFFFALPLGISCSVITSHEIRRVRELYGIDGSHTKDISTAVFCPCCSILRNELEVRTREEERWNDKHGVVETPYIAEKPMTSALPPGVFLPGKENRAPHKDSSQSASGAKLRKGDGPRRLSASSAQQSARGQSPAKKTPSGEAAASIRSNNSSLSLDSSGNGGPITCTVVDSRDRGLLTPVMERLSEDTMSTAKRSKVCASPPLQGENIPLGSIQEGTPPGSEGEKSAAVSSPLVSRPTSPRKSIDRPGTPIPREGATSPNLSLRSGRSGQFFHRVPLVPVNDAVPSPVQELVEDGQVPTETQPIPAVKTYQGQEPFVAVTPISRSSHLLPSDKLETEPNPRDTTPHVMIQGWLKEVGSSPRRESIDVPVNALSQHGDLTAKATNNHKISNSTLNPPAPSTLPENGTDITPTAVDKDEVTLDTAKGQEGVKQAGKPTTLSAIGTTITDAIKSLIPAAASSVTNFPVHNVPLPRRAAPADDRQDQTSRAVDTNDAIPKTVRVVDVAEVTDTVGQPATDTGTISAKTITEISKPDAPKQKEPVSNITVSDAPTPAIPPRPQASRLSVGRPATTAAVPEPAREPPTPAPPGRYPPTPAAVGEDPLSDPSAADKGPFVSFRAKQLLGHFLARDAPPRPSADRVTARPSRGARRDSLGHDDRVWGSRARD